MIPSTPKDTSDVRVADTLERGESGEPSQGFSREGPDLPWKEQAKRDLRLSKHRET